MIGIIGSGPSGLMAAWACIQSGQDFEILTNTYQKPFAKGFQYLHERCDLPLINYGLTKIYVPKNLLPEDFSRVYSEKIYSVSDISRVNKTYFDSSIDDCYNLSDALTYIWDLVYPNVTECKITCFNDIINLNSKYEFVFSTVPLDQFFECKYSTTYVATRQNDTKSEMNNFVIFNANKFDNIVRYGNLFGTIFSETLTSTSRYSLPVKKVVGSVELPSGLPENIIFTGRYGSWNKQVLVTDVYKEVLSTIG
jgi:hypothetical protein